MTLRRFVLPITVYAALLSSAPAATVTLTDAWQNLGTGPFILQTQGGDGMFEASAAAPTDNGLAVGKNQVPFAYPSTLSIWGKRRAQARNNAGAPVDTTVVVTSMTLAGGGSSTFTQTVPPASGTGGTSALTLQTSPTTNAIPAASRKSLLITNQSATASATFCFAGSNITPAANAAGCYTLLPNGGFLSYPASGYVPQDAFNAVASAANTPVTVEAH